MASRVLRVPKSNDELRQGVARIQEELQLAPDFPAAVEAAAVAAAAAPRLPNLDLTELPFVTIDPATARDLDQAMHLSRSAEGYVVRYAIADVMAFLTPGDPVDLESQRRGESLYGADSKIPLHPEVLSEDAASLLPDQVRPAFVWTLTLDATGECTDARVERALVRSVAKLSYEQVQADESSELFGLLQEIGELRVAKETERGGVSLPLPEQEIVIEEESWSLEFRTLLPVENWNAQLSLLTGFEAARMMLDHKVGILRTLPPPEDRAVERLRRTARALKVDWPADLAYPDFIRTLDVAQPNQAAMVVASTSLLRGAGYAGFEGEVPDQVEHSALASPYAHVTAPLRRLVDRFGLETCAALCAGTEVPSWVTERLADLPSTMQESGRRANTYENAVLDFAEAEMLKDRVGESFEAVVLELDREDPEKADIQIAEPAIEATATGTNPPVGERVQVTLTEADPATRRIHFSL